MLNGISFSGWPAALQTILWWNSLSIVGGLLIAAVVFGMFGEMLWKVLAGARAVGSPGWMTSIDGRRIDESIALDRRGSVMQSQSASGADALLGDAGNERELGDRVKSGGLSS